jgi:hypothetical protein
MLNITSLTTRPFERVIGVVSSRSVASSAMTWLHRPAEADAHGVRFDDPLDGCYRSPIDGSPEPSVQVDLDERILLIATFTGDPRNLGAELARRVVNDDVRFALDLGQPTEREGYVDYAVLLVTGSDVGTPYFLRQECPASDDWLR